MSDSKTSGQLSLFHWWNEAPDTEPYGPHEAAARLPVHEGGFVWGRSGFQWMKSIIAYLEWREGSAWRPETHRNHPVRLHYLECIALVQSAYFRNVNWWSASAPNFPMSLVSRGELRHVHVTAKREPVKCDVAKCLPARAKKKRGFA